MSMEKIEERLEEITEQMVAMDEDAAIFISYHAKSKVGGIFNGDPLEIAASLAYSIKKDHRIKRILEIALDMHEFAIKGTPTEISIRAMA